MPKSRRALGRAGAARSSDSNSTRSDTAKLDRAAPRHLARRLSEQPPVCRRACLGSTNGSPKQIVTFWRCICLGEVQSEEAL